MAEKEGPAKVEPIPVMRRASEEPRIKRKPVPSAADLDEDAELVDGVKRVSITHAL
jgi:hypothetical protein